MAVWGGQSIAVFESVSWSRRCLLTENEEITNIPQTVSAENDLFLLNLNRFNLCAVSGFTDPQKSPAVFLEAGQQAPLPPDPDPADNCSVSS